MKGRPSTFSQDTVDSICELLTEGRSLKSITRQDDMPAASTVFKWLAAHPSFADQYARAMEVRADVLADEITDIADERDEDPARQRLRVDARKWAASKLKPKKYGDRHLVGSDPENPLPQPVGLDVSKLSNDVLREILAAKSDG